MCDGNEDRRQHAIVLTWRLVHVSLPSGRQVLFEIFNRSNNIWAREIGVGLELHIEIEVPDCLTVAEGEVIKESTSQIVKGLFEREATVKVLLIPTAQES